MIKRGHYLHPLCWWEVRGSFVVSKTFFWKCTREQRCIILPDNRISCALVFHIVSCALQGYVSPVFVFYQWEELSNNVAVFTTCKPSPCISTAVLLSCCRVHNSCVSHILTTSLIWHPGATVTVMYVSDCASTSQTCLRIYFSIRCCSKEGRRRRRRRRRRRGEMSHQHPDPTDRSNRQSLSEAGNVPAYTVKYSLVLVKLIKYSILNSDI